MSNRATSYGRGRGLVWAAAFAVVGALVAWLPWMGWGMVEGSEYAVWQVVGSGVTFAVVAFALGWHRHVVSAILVLPLTYTAAWTVSASDDPTGLFMVGAVMVLVGTVVGAVVVAALGAGLGAGTGAWRRRRASAR